MKSLLAGLGALGAPRLAALAGVGAATLGLLLFLTLRLSADAPMSLLYADLDLRDASAMTDLLDKGHIAHKLDAGGTTILVPHDQVAQARLLLAQGGLPSGGSIGYEIFDRGDGLTASQFQQSINQTRALEGELARSIRMIHGVRAVRVHLVLAKREPFAQEQQQAQASVLLTMSGAARMDRDGVQAVLNLVAAAVPSLKPQNIAIVDNHGELLARAGQPTDGSQTTATQEELRQATETRLSHAVEEMLERSVGQGHVRAEAAVTMDFDQSRETNEKFDPDGQVPRSTQTITNTSKSTEKDNSVSVQNNLPNPDPVGGGAGSSEQHQEETTNFEIGKTTRTVVHDQPQIRRITLAVMVDGISSAGAGGKLVWQPRSQDELDRFGALARSVIGFDDKRGDKVDIVSMKFNDDAGGPADPPRDMLGLGFDKSDVMRLVQMGLLGVVMLVAVLMVLRPAAMRLTASPAAQLAAGAGSLLAGPAGAQDLLAAPQGAAGLLADESMVSMANVEGSIRASSIRRIADLVDKHPEESVAIMRGWMATEDA